MGGVEESQPKNDQRSDRSFITRIIIGFYEQLIQFDCQLKDLYEMTLKELEMTLINRRKGLAYKIWKLALFTHSPFVKEFPKTPQDAMPELYPTQTGIPMPDFLKEKAMKRGVM